MSEEGDFEEDRDLATRKKNQKKDAKTPMTKYKVAKELGLYLGDFECWICGHSVYEGHEKCHGFQENHEGEKQLICSTCFQVQCTINKDCLHKEGCNGSPFKRMYLVSSDEKRVTIYEVLDHEPWLKMTQSGKSEVVAS